MKHHDRVKVAPATRQQASAKLSALQVCWIQPFPHKPSILGGFALNSAADINPFNRSTVTREKRAPFTAAPVHGRTFA